MSDTNKTWTRGAVVVNTDQRFPVRTPFMPVLIIGIDSSGIILTMWENGSIGSMGPKTFLRTYRLIDELD